MKKLSIMFIIMFLCHDFSWAVGGGAFSNALYSAKSISMGFTGVARDDDPSVAFFNPAGAVAQKHIALQFGLSPVSFDTEFKGANGASAKMDDSIQAPPYFYSVIPIQEKLSFTFGINSPFGLATEWPANSAVRYDATKSKLVHFQLNPSLAYQVNDKFSVGAGLVYAYSDVTLEKKVNTTGINFLNFADPTPRADANSKVTGNGDGWGYNLGFLFKPAEKHNIGVNYRSRIKTTVSGTTELNGLSGPIVTGAGAASDYKVNTKASLPLPESLMLGYAFTPGKWTFELDGEYIGWGSVDKLALNYSGQTNAVNDSILAAGAVQDFDYHNIWNVGFGTNYKLTDVWDLRGGLLHYSAAGSDRTFATAIPDSERTGITLGFGFNKPSYVIDFAYNYDWAVERTIAAGESSVGTSTGKFSTTIQAVSLSYTYKFGGKRS